MSSMTEKSNETGRKDAGSPKKGEHFRCTKCGMAIEVTADCRCDQPEMAHFQCCGQEMQKA